MNVAPFSRGPQHIGARITAAQGKSFVVDTESNYSLDDSATPWLSAALPVAMKVNVPIEFDGTIDEVAAENSNGAQNILAEWYPRHYHRTTFGSRNASSTTGRAPGVGCFFSGGVDSFYSAITQHDRITHLIFVHGYDIRPDDETLGTRALEGARAAASELGKPLIEVRTTLRSAFSDAYRVPWGHVYHGAALAHVATALSPHLGTVIVPSSYPLHELRPWGSHPDLDPTWSTSAVTIEHGELDAGRFDKIARIVDSPTAMNHLRVCWENRDGRYNCERCFKCFRTRLGIMLAGGECATLSSPIDPTMVRRMYIEPARRRRFREALVELDERGFDEPELEKAMRSAIRRSYLLQYFPR
ncbi:hypothetical protein NWF34_04150 [Gordonia sp. GONU]|uniref:Uncharacterized protein n=2 Tax=Gordoniaceae TaxID=85026 RepID=A0AAE4R140_9ACTN|nr:MULTISPECIES: hypothetical protein [Gordonia]KAF0970243.1 hypothetical protein BPODLACK_01296 [Gordonia sp. YY1]MCR8896147.1 hypothetical protein [Gordonia sp. GONU]MDV6306560.1 hypothetical protein [Gordonia amicalis]MDV6311289.1 hypothetical protein [Gordonia amicalis]